MKFESNKITFIQENVFENVDKMAAVLFRLQYVRYGGWYLMDGDYKNCRHQGWCSVNQISLRPGDANLCRGIASSMVRVMVHSVQCQAITWTHATYYQSNL